MQRAHRTGQEHLEAARQGTGKRECDTIETGPLGRLKNVAGTSDEVIKVELVNFVSQALRRRGFWWYRRCVAEVGVEGPESFDRNKEGESYES